MGSLFGLYHVGFVQNLYLWQIFTYMFLHGGWFHIIINLLYLWMFAGELEQIWGSRRFIRFYLICGLGGGILIAFINYLTYNPSYMGPVTVGASGAIFGILIAYGMIWPNREILIFFVFPVKIKYFMIVLVLIQFFGTLNMASGAGTSNISYSGHLGGLITGFILMYTMMRRPVSSPKKKQSADKSVISKAFKKARVKKKKKDIETRIKAKKIIDELLEKIARDGMSSLSPKERKDLEWARRHYYPERDDTLH
jgi:membrane associated rhomboid family serine protease